MDAVKVYEEIQQLPAMAGGIRQRQPQAIKFLQQLYLKVTGSTVYAGCKGCHIKAANYLMSLTIEKLQTMSEQKFTMKKGIMIEYPFRSGQYLTSKSLTDEKAAEYLMNNPKGVEHFSDFPSDENGNVDLSQWYPAESDQEEKADQEAPAKAKAGKKADQEAPAPKSEEENENTEPPAAE